MGYVVSLTGEGTQLVEGSYTVEALYRGEAKERGIRLARDEVEAMAALVVIDVDVRAV